ncbi:hypothetical protein [Janibacter sp. G56]|uniref:hypothetical protein n=1 Tax=Janibacter sp. G56 TaxID=3418717 RepID=UPI003CFEC9F8
MSRRSYQGRHAPAPGAPRDRHPATSVLARTGAKAVVGLGLVSGVTAAVAAPSADLTSFGRAATTAAGSQPVALATVANDRVDHVASRSSARGALTASSKAAGPTSVRRIVTVEAKPKPKPKPTVTPTPTETPSDTASESAADAAAAAPTETTTPTATQAPAPTTQAPTGAGQWAAEAAAKGLGPNASLVYAAVKNNFPQISTIGGYRAGDGGDHGSGRAVDIMVTGSLGDSIAAYMQAHAGELNIAYVIWQQRIWFPGGGWSPMEDRGSATANHYDHVHVSVS